MLSIWHDPDDEKNRLQDITVFETRGQRMDVEEHRRLRLACGLRRTSSQGRERPVRTAGPLPTAILAERTDVRPERGSCGGEAGRLARRQA